MNWRLDPPIQIGKYHVAAISNSRRSVAARDGVIRTFAQKRFLAAVIIDGDAITLLGADGAEIPEADFEPRFPNAIAQAKKYATGAKTATAE